MAPQNPGQGLPFEKVMIEQIVIEENYASVRNEFGRNRQVPLQTRAKGMLPAEGETWIVSREMGHWTFALCVLPQPPTITGSTDGLPALVNLLEQLEAAGLIIDGTTSTRIRATHTHVHTDPQGGSTGTDAL